MRQKAILILAVTLATAACAPPATQTGPAPNQSQQPTAPKRLVAAIMGDPHTVYQSLNPASRVRGIEHIQALVAGQLTREGESVRLPELAEQVPSVENGLWKVNPNGTMETTWKIKPGVEWHDGVPFTSNDLLFTAQVVRDPELPILGHTAYQYITDVAAPDPRTVIVHWKQPYIDADTMFGSPAVPFARHKLEKAYIESKETFTDDPYWSFDYIGTGPFKIKSWERGSHMVVSANDKYVLGRPKIDEVEYRFIADASVTQASLLSGAVDMTLGRNLSGPQAVEVANRWSDGKMTVDFSAASQIALYVQHLNPSPALMTNLAFKQAALHAIDRQQLVDNLAVGESAVAHSYLRPGQAAYAEIEARNLRKYAFDPRQTAQLMESIGYTRGPDGLLRDGGGQPLAWETRTTAGDDLREKMLFAIQGFWKDAGFDATTYVIPRQQAADLEYRATYPGMELVRQGLDHTGARSITSRNTPLPENNFRVTGNRSRYVSSELDALIDRYYTTIPLPERRETMGQIVRHLSENLPFLQQLYTSSVQLVNNRVINFKADGPWNSHEWDVRS